MKSVFVFARVLADGCEVFAVGEGVVPPGCRSLATFRDLPEAIAFRNKKRREVRWVHPKASGAL